MVRVVLKYSSIQNPHSKTEVEYREVAPKIKTAQSGVGASALGAI
jgi:hypothetical protein